MNTFDWLGLAQAITQAHCEARGLKVSASTLPALGRSQTSLADEGDSSVASPSFQGLTIENLVSTVERIQK